VKRAGITEICLVHRIGIGLALPRSIRGGLPVRLQRADSPDRSAIPGVANGKPTATTFGPISAYCKTASAERRGLGHYRRRVHNCMGGIFYMGTRHNGRCAFCKRQRAYRCHGDSEAVIFRQMASPISCGAIRGQLRPTTILSAKCKAATRSRR
jgi:hypothetical protein